MVRCEDYFEENLEAVQDGCDEEVAFFPGSANSRAYEDTKRMKLCSMGSSTDALKLGVASLA
jgi:hypothetical protein